VTGHLRANFFIAAILGGLTGACTALLGHTDISFLVSVLIPGLIGSMAIAQNVHAFSLTLAACFNFLFYFLLSLAVGSLVGRLRRSYRSHKSASNGDNLT
jgi:phosphotransferase system  glucose/maltose/N-acetylglucosamine-specific IIC component